MQFSQAHFTVNRQDEGGLSKTGVLREYFLVD
jgi:hypothetical protein